METPTDNRIGGRAHLPGWLSNPDGVAPCVCGRPLQPGEPHIVAAGEHGLKRWLHRVCWQMMFNDDDEWDDEDWDNEEDSD